MHPYQRLLAVLFIFFVQSGCPATLCLQNRETQTYEALNKTHDCALPDAFNPSQPLSTNHEKLTAVRDPDDAAQNLQDIRNALTPAEAHWELRAPDSTVYAALKRWSALAGWQVSWEIPVDFPVEIHDDYYGKFEESVRRVLTALKVADYPPYPCFHENNVVRIVRRIQGNGDECQQ